MLSNSVFRHNSKKGVAEIKSSKDLQLI